MEFLANEVEKTAAASLYTKASKSFANPASAETLVVSACRVLEIPSPASPLLWDPQQPAGGTFRAAIGLPTQAPVAGVFWIGWGSQTSGTLTTGKRYIITAFVALDVFTNVGAGSNATGVIFTATGTTPATWTHGSTLTEITTDLAYTATFTTINTALNLLASITAAGGVAVTLNGASFLIAWTLVGSREEITADATNLAPAGTVAEIGTELDGSATVREVQFLRFVQSPAAFVDLTDAAPAAAGSVTVLSTGGVGPPEVNSSYQVKLFTSTLNVPYDGTFSLTFLAETSPLISFDATAEDVLAAFAQMKIFNSTYAIEDVSVSRQAAGVYLIGFQGDAAGTNIGTMTIDVSGLKSVPYMTGELDLSDPGIQLLFGTATTTQAVFVIEYTPSGGSRREIYRKAITLDQSLIPDGALTPTPRILFYTIAETDAAIAAAVGALVFGTIASQDANAVAITGGTLDSVTITNVSTFNDVVLDGSSGVVLTDTGSFTTVNFGLASSFTLAAGKALIVSNTMVLTGTDGVAINLGAVNGTLGTAAFTAATAYAASGAVVSSGLTQATARLLGRTTAATGAIEQITVGSGLTFSATNLAVTSPYDPAALAATGGTINGATLGLTTPARAIVTGLGASYIQRTSTYTYTSADFTVDCTSGTFAVNLPTAVGIAGRIYVLRNSGAGTITLTGNGAELIDASNTAATGAGVTRRVQSTGTGWISI